ncbi:hypothetical protein C4564_02895 [Candidatus Microgenomates bacterium]|nr:MAG: hypothetical protein C4564_02895 [Candidatus Microgenomates bacterium]
MAANLTMVAVSTRKIIRYGLAGVILLLIGRAIFTFAVTLYQQNVPKAPPPPTIGFGPLPAIAFPDEIADSSQVTYTTETPSGSFPAFPSQMPVYFIPAPSAGLFAYDTMVEKAAALDFRQPPVQISRNLYKFSHASLPATLESDIVSGSFSLSFNLSADASVLAGVAPDEQTGINRINSALSGAKINTKDLVGTPSTEFLRIEGQNLVRAISRSEAQFIQVSLYRNPVTVGEEPNQQSYPAKTADPKKSNVWFIVASSGGVNALIAGEFKHFPLNTNRVESYPIKTAAQAFEELQAGKGFVANLGLTREGNIPVRRIYLAYFDPPTPGVFYQPVVVFEGGDNEFVAYVPAITEDYYGQAPVEN